MDKELLDLFTAGGTIKYDEDEPEGWIPAQDWYKNPNDALYALVEDEIMQQELRGMDDYKKLIRKS